MDFNQLLQYFNSLTAGLEIKYAESAKSAETTESGRHFYDYVSSLRRTNTFMSFKDYTPEMFIEAGLTQEDIDEYIDDIVELPSSAKRALLEVRRRHAIDDFEELNDYYRPYVGLPPVDYETTDFIYCVDNILELDTIESFTNDDGYTIYGDIGDFDNIDEELIPIHQLSVDTIISLREKGFLNLILTENTDKYLKYLGENKLDIIRIRELENFEIMSFTGHIPDDTFQEFTTIYETMRDYVISVFYVREFNKRYKFYDNFVAMMITYMSFLRMMINTYKGVTAGSYTNPDLIAMQFDSYGIEYNENILLSYNKLISDNIPYMVRYTASEFVLNYLKDILDLEDAEICYLYLVKNHKLGEDNRPVFPKARGVVDNTKKFDLYFQQVPMGEKDIQPFLLDPDRRFEFEEVVSKDPYWYASKDEIYELIATEDYNYGISKYLSIDTSSVDIRDKIDIANILRFIIFNRKINSSEITVSIPRYSINKHSLFDVIVLLSALESKIRDRLDEIHQLFEENPIGFNFNADIDSIRAYINESDVIEDYSKEILLKLMMVFSTDDVGSICSTFDTIVKIKEYLHGVLDDGDAGEEYGFILEELFCNTYSEEIFGNAETFEEYLQLNNLELYNLLQSTDESSSIKLASALVQYMTSISDKFNVLHYVYCDEHVNLNVLKNMVRHFKSYEMELIDL